MRRDRERQRGSGTVSLSSLEGHRLWRMVRQGILSGSWTPEDAGRCWGIMGVLRDAAGC